MRFLFLRNASWISSCLLGAVLATQTTAQETSFSDLVIQGYEFESQSNYQAAIEQYTQALLIKDESVTVLIRRAYSLVQTGEFEKAGEDLKAATYATPVTMSDYTSLAWLKATCPFKVIRDGVVAVAYGRKALKERESAETFDILGAAYAEMNDFQRARNMVLEGIKRFPDSKRIPAMRERLVLYKQKEPFRESWL
ncbi:MAG: hypothetical protein AAF558_12745, partial [Verrucomicrobiota bacterium]